MYETPYMLEAVRPHNGRGVAADFALLPFVDPLPPVPAMPATMLQLELLLQESLVDLRAVSAVVLSDAGATLQILRMVGEEFPNEKGRPTRIEDCIASLNSDDWYTAIQKQDASRNVQVATEWQRCRRIGACARELARDFDGVSPEEAYLVGLLHRLGAFPQVLGWSDVCGDTKEHYALGLMLADFWQLPRYLACAIREQQTPCVPMIWRELLHMATDLADPI